MLDTEAANTHSEYVIFIAFLLQDWFTTAPPCYAIRILRVLLSSDEVQSCRLHEVKQNGERFFRALKGFIILEISLEMRTVLFLILVIN